MASSSIPTIVCDVEHVVVSNLDIIREEHNSPSPSYASDDVSSIGMGSIGESEAPPSVHSYPYIPQDRYVTGSHHHGSIRRSHRRGASMETCNYVAEYDGGIPRGITAYNRSRRHGGMSCHSSSKRSVIEGDRWEQYSVDGSAATNDSRPVIPRRSMSSGIRKDVALAPSRCSNDARLQHYSNNLQQQQQQQQQQQHNFQHQNQYQQQQYHHNHQQHSSQSHSQAGSQSQSQYPHCHSNRGPSAGGYDRYHPGNSLQPRPNGNGRPDRMMRGQAAATEQPRYTNRAGSMSQRSASGRSSCSGGQGDQGFPGPGRMATPSQASPMMHRRYSSGRSRPQTPTDAAGRTVISAPAPRHGHASPHSYGYPNIGTQSRPQPQPQPQPQLPTHTHTHTHGPSNAQVHSRLQPQQQHGNSCAFPRQSPITSSHCQRTSGPPTMRPSPSEVSVTRQDSEQPEAPNGADVRRSTMHLQTLVSPTSLSKQKRGRHSFDASLKWDTGERQHRHPYQFRHRRFLEPCRSSSSPTRSYSEEGYGPKDLINSQPPKPVRRSMPHLPPRPPPPPPLTPVTRPPPISMLSPEPQSMTVTSVSTTSSSPAEAPKRPVEVEIAPGIWMELRGANETWEAVSTGQYCPATCLDCNTSLLCVMDAQSILCPTCKVVSPILEDPTGVRNGQTLRGVGLGFTPDQLIQWQSDLARGVDVRRTILGS